MRIALLGGSGRIGTSLLSCALQAGHEVTALARRPESLAAAAALTVISGDAADADAVFATIDGADAVLSALGPRGAKTPALLDNAARNMVAGMHKAEVQRLIAVSAAGAFISGDPDMGAVTKFVLPRLLRSQLADVQQMESQIAASGLDWTLVRATRLVDTPATGRYRVRPSYPPAGGRKISRADVAHFMQAALLERSWIQARPVLAY